MNSLQVSKQYYSYMATVNIDSK